MPEETFMSLFQLSAPLLSIVALAVTIIGFFASLKFYRDGVELQRKANSALTRVDEKTQSIQSKVGGMFDKTLDAALGRTLRLEGSFDALDQQLEEAAQSIVEAATEEITTASAEERERITEVVSTEVDRLRDQLAVTRESAEEVAESSVPDLPRSELQARIFHHLASTEKRLTAKEIASSVGYSRGYVETALSRLIASDLVEGRTRGGEETYTATAKLITK